MRVYGVGEAELVVVVVLVSVLVLGLDVVVVLVVVSEVVPLGLAAGAVVSVFCSQAANKAAPAKMQRNLFIMCGVEFAILS